ncbi:MAG: trigger factor [Bacteroidota bacterium]|nr:trigger factor [Bacteroidota bacterium]
MNITREDTGTLNAVLKVELNPADYQGKVEKILKDYQHKANMPGFRPGKVPYSMIKRMYGAAVTADELNKTVSENLNSYITENKLEILGSPIAINDGPLDLDVNEPGDVTFKFEIGLQPEINIEVNSSLTVDYYNIIISDEMVDHYVDDIRKRHGKQVPVDVAEATDRLSGSFAELENGEPKENGIKKDASILIEAVKDEALKNQFIGLTAGTSVVFNPMKAFENAVEVGAMLGIETEKAELLTSDFSYTVNEITHQEEPELNEEFFALLYPGDELKTVEDFRERIRKDAASSFEHESDRAFLDKAIKQLIEQANLELPDSFLKRWIVNSNEGKITTEQVDAEYEHYANSVKWQLIENKIMVANDIKVTEEDIRSHYRSMFRFSEDMDENTRNQIEGIVDSFMKNTEEVRKINDQLHDKKILDLLKSVVTLNLKEVSYEDFIKLATDNK